MKVVAFYTKNTPYELVYNQHLAPSLKKFNMNLHLETVENSGSWIKNTCLKPVILLKALNTLNEDLLYLDVDAEVVQFPQLIDDIPAEYDVAWHYLDWDKHYNRVGCKKELITCTMMLRNNDKVKKLLQDWIDIGNHDTDQHTLDRAMLNNKDLKIYELPEEYACILDRYGFKPGYIKQATIIQHQASRNNKRIVTV